MPDETLHDLMVQVGLRSTRPRPLPQSMRPAWETTPEANQPYRAPQQALADPNTIPYQRQPLQQERDMNRELAQLTDRQSIGGAAGHADGREAREFGQQVMEMTGAPSWARGIDHLQNNQPGEAIPEFLMGALNTGTLATLHYGAGPARPPMRLPNAPIEAAPRLPNAPPRLPGRATDGSVLPIRPPQPIRQSLVGGSDDLMEAARIGPDAGPVQGENGANRIVGYRAENAGREDHGVEWWSGSPATAEQYTYGGIEGSTMRRQELAPQNPLVLDLGGRHIDSLRPDEIPHATIRQAIERQFGSGRSHGDAIVEEARKAGYDAVIFRNARDPALSNRGAPDTIVAMIARTAPDGGPVQAGRAPLGRGRSKTVYDDPADPARVIVEMPPDPVTEAFLQFSRDAHARGLPFARHLPNPDAVESAGNVVRYRTERLAPNDTRARVGRENGEFFITGVDDVEQSGSIIAAMNALDDHLRRTLPPNTPRHFYDLGPQNFMRRADGTLVINDPVESTGFAAHTAPDGGPVQAGRLPRRVEDFRTPRGETHEIIANPTEADILRLTKPGRVAAPGSAIERGGPPVSSSRGVRYVKDAEGNVYVGNSYDVTHHDLVTHYGLPNRGSLDGGEIVRLPDGTLELQNNDGAMPLPRGWLNPSRNAPNAGPPRTPPRPRPPPRRPTQ